MTANLNDSKTILVVDDEEGIRYGHKTLFKREGFRVFESGTFDDAIAITKKNKIDIALLDIRLKGKRDGIDLLKKLKLAEPGIIILMLTGHGSIDSSVRAMKEGASDYILKPADNVKLLDAVNKQFEIKNLRNENSYLKKTLRDSIFTYDFITDNHAVKEILKVADKVKNTPATVLITGESGTGKEVLAKYIHFTSSRREDTFVGVNCAALSDTLLLSELFGHEKGSFTGADGQKIGKFELADSGTLFLDEIGDMSLEAQAKLLRVLEERNFERVGGIKKVHVDVRLIAATNKNLIELIENNLFRKDLYYRLNVISCHLPPLRERPEDIPFFANFFLSQYNRKYNKNVLRINDSLLKRLSDYKWHGNVRELQNLINQSVLLCEGPEIESFNLHNDFKPEAREADDLIGVGKSFKEAMEDVLNYHEEKIIKRALISNNQNRSKTAIALDITRKTLARKIDKYNL